MAQNPPANVGDLGSIPGSERGSPLEKEMTNHSSILVWKNPMDRGAWRAIVPGGHRVGHDLATEQQQPIGKRQMDFLEHNMRRRASSGTERKAAGTGRVREPVDCEAGSACGLTPRDPRGQVPWISVSMEDGGALG